MTADRASLVQALEQTHPTLVQLTAPLDAAALDFRASRDEWSIREILAHLVDDEMYVMRTRLERIVKEDHPHLTPHDESDWMREGYQPEFGHFTGEGWLKRWVDHDTMHIRQIESNLEAYRQQT